MVAPKNNIPRRRASDAQLDRIDAEIARLGRDLVQLQLDFHKHEQLGTERSEHLLAELHDMSEKLQAISEREKEHETMKDNIAALDEQIRGNGKPGLIIQVDRIINMLKTQEEAAQKRAESWTWLSRLVVASLVTSVITMLLDIFLHK